jgi:hypothetical protein
MTVMLTIVCFVCSLSEGIICSSGSQIELVSSKIFGRFEYFVNKKLNNWLLNACNRHSVLTEKLNNSSNAMTISDGLGKTEIMHFYIFSQLY